MKTIDNINALWGDDLKAELSKNLTPNSSTPNLANQSERKVDKSSPPDDQTSEKTGVHTGVKDGKLQLKIAAACFSVYAFEALKKELQQIDNFEFIFTEPTFVPEPDESLSTRQRREFYIPQHSREKDFYGSEFEIQLKNKLNQKAIATECARWIKKKAQFRSNISSRPMQKSAFIQSPDQTIAYTPIRGFTAADLGYQQSDAMSNFINKFDEAQCTTTWLNSFNQLWADKKQLQDVTDRICAHVESVYEENSPEKIYFFILYNIFNEFLEDINEDLLPNDRTGYKDSLIWNKLYQFQKDAALGIINKLESYNGCILADSVGLGKTFTALAVIKYYELRNKQALVLCPKKLADNWQNYNQPLTTNILAKDRFNYRVLCHTDLQRTKGYSLGVDLNKINWGNFDLVVIDESHNFRNNNAFSEKENRYQRLRKKVIQAGVQTKVLMLSATPVNNRFNDLKNQLALSYEEASDAGQSEALKSKLKITSNIGDVFRHAQAAFNAWSKLTPSERTAEKLLNNLSFDFFKILDGVTIARSRKHIRDYYDMKGLTFPQRKTPIAEHPPLSHRQDIMPINEIYLNLKSLKLCVYMPMTYVFDSRMSKYKEKYDAMGARGNIFQHVDRERSLSSLMTTNLLKRLESSVEAFRLTLQSLMENYQETLNQIDEFKKNKNNSSSKVVMDGSSSEATIDATFGITQDMEFEDDDLSGGSEFAVGNKVQIDLQDVDILLWGQDLEKDFQSLQKLWAEISKISPAEDAKLQSLTRRILDKTQNPINKGNKKVLIFTAFADTAQYLYKNLHPKLSLNHLHTAVVTGSRSPQSTLNKIYDFQSILTLFSPLSKDKNLTLPDEKNNIEVLIGTDCISEGQNLQDCDYVINYDIHWNPVRIIQRFGRVDRIGSQNKEIQLVNYWPDITLDEYINLKERVENRMVAADLTATGDDNILLDQDKSLASNKNNEGDGSGKDGKVNDEGHLNSNKTNNSDLSYRQDQLRRLQNEVVDLEDVKTGVSITDLGLSDFHMDLLNYIKNSDDENRATHLGNLPTGLHAMVPARVDIGLRPGVVFVLRNLKQKTKATAYNMLHPYYLVYVDHEGQPVLEQNQSKKLLDLVRGGCRNVDKPVYKLCQAFNADTDQGRKMKKYSTLLDKAIASIVQTKEAKDVDSLFAGPQTTALRDTISGLGDFELVAFLIVR